MIAEDSWLAERSRLLERIKEAKPIAYPIRKPDAQLRVAIATPEEIPIVYDIMRIAFAEYIGKLDPPSGATLATLQDVQKTIQEGGAVLGRIEQQPVASAQFRVRPDHLYIGRLSVLPTCRGRGIASSVLDYMEYLARLLDRPQLRLGTRLSLPKNIALYRRHGFEIDAIVRPSTGSDSIVWMVKPLAS